MKRIFLTSATLIIFLTTSLQTACAAPATASGTQKPKALNATSEPSDDYISLRWMIYMMLLSLPFAPSQTQYAPIQIPVNIPRFKLPEPKVSLSNTAKLTVPPTSIPKLKMPQTGIPKLKQPQS